MKSRNILDSMGYIDDDMIEDAEQNSHKRRKSIWLKCVCAAVFLLLIAAAAIAVVPMFIRSEPENNGVFWVDDRPRNDNGIVAEEAAIEWPWNCREVCEQFPEIRYNGAVYTTRTGYTGEDISENLTGKKIGEGTAQGYDVYEDGVQKKGKFARMFEEEYQHALQELDPAFYETEYLDFLADPKNAGDNIHAGACGGSGGRKPCSLCSR